MKNPIYILILAIFFLANQDWIYGQGGGDSVLVQNYSFDEEGEWQSMDSILWSHSDSLSFGGAKSMRYRIPGSAIQPSGPIMSIETGHTIQKVRTAQWNDEAWIVASSYEGTVMGVSFGGAIIWKNRLSGFMVHDIWCDDLTGDGNDEVIVANADGALYCLDSSGKIIWEFRPDDVPMYATCIVRDNGTPYVVCGGFDLSIYYLSADGDLVKEIKSSSYSNEKAWGSGYLPPNNLHYANFLRPVQKEDGSEMLVLHGSNNHMQVKGTLYMFDILADMPFEEIKVASTEQIGEFRTSDSNHDGISEILLGFSSHQNGTQVTKYDLAVDTFSVQGVSGLGFGYSVLQPEWINDQGEEKYFLLVGNHIILRNSDLIGGEERLECAYSFNDMWKEGDRIILASAQSGGSCIHILNTMEEGWKQAYREIDPPGKIQAILKNTQSYRDLLGSYEKPVGEREPRTVYLMTENTDDGLAKSVADNIRANYSSPVFLNGAYTGLAENWDRSEMENEKYRDKRDRRRQYILSQQECLDLIIPWYDNEPGAAYWGGHGNDPYMFHIETTKKILDSIAPKKTVLIYPELEDHSEDFAWVMEDLFYPLADHARISNANIFVRSKHNFWQGNVYLPMWEKMMDGYYPDVFVSGMEETTDKAMDISVAGRVGVWVSGAMNDWGTRSVPDNPSFDRSRQFSNQRLPNHFLRHLVYHIANGATYINNFAVYPDYMSFLWELIAKGALYVPKTDEILSFSPVHISMKEPDEHYMNEASSLKWSTFYDREFEENNPFVFSRHNATWMAAAVTPWDFSAIAGGVKDRRQNYLPPYPNGLVVITPPQEGVFAKQGIPRPALKDQLHPLYSNILTEFITDGRHYYSSDGTQTFAADEYASVVSEALKEGASKLPLSVEGDVAWVVAQTAPDNLRLTIIDGGYLNPNDREAIISFHAVTPASMTDIIDGKSFNISNPTAVKVDVPLGLFRFIDIKLSEDL